RSRKSKACSASSWSLTGSPSADAWPHPRMHRALTILAFVCFATSLFVRPFDPVIPQIAAGLMVDTATAALLSTAFSLPYAATQPILGALADMLGKVRLMMASLLILVLAGFAGALATNFSV